MNEQVAIIPVNRTEPRLHIGFAKSARALTLLIYVVAVTVGAFSGGLWAALGMGGAVLLSALVWCSGKRFPFPEKAFIVFAGISLAVMALLNLHSSETSLSWQEWVKLITIFFPLSFLLSPQVAPYLGSPRFFKILTVALILGGLALSLELFLKAPLLHALRGPAALVEGYNRGLSYIVLMAFPVMAAIWNSKTRWLVIGFFVLLLIPASLSESRTAKLALILAVPVVVLAQFWPLFVTRLLTLAPFAVLGWPFAARWFFLNEYDVLFRIPASWRARIEIWDYMSYRISEHPLLGWGLGSSHMLDWMSPHGPIYVYTTEPAGHPHNVVTQLWVELGIPGLILGVLFALLTLWKAYCLDPRVRPFALGAWVVGFCLCLLAYNFWTDSLMAAFAMTGVAFVMLGYDLNARKQPRALRSSAAGPEAH